MGSCGCGVIGLPSPALGTSQGANEGESIDPAESRKHTPDPKFHACFRYFRGVGFDAVPPYETTSNHGVIGHLTGSAPPKTCFCFKLDAKSVPEALATTILILQKFSIDLAHRQNPGASAHPAPSDTPHPHPIRTPSAPHPPP